MGIISLEPRLCVPDFVLVALEKNQSCETKSGTESLGSRLGYHTMLWSIIYRKQANMVAYGSVLPMDQCCHSNIPQFVHLQRGPMTKLALSLLHYTLHCQCGYTISMGTTHLTRSLSTLGVYQTN